MIQTYLRKTFALTLLLFSIATVPVHAKIKTPDGWSKSKAQNGMTIYKSADGKSMVAVGDKQDIRPESFDITIDIVTQQLVRMGTCPGYATAQIEDMGGNVGREIFVETETEVCSIMMFSSKKGARTIMTNHVPGSAFDARSLGLEMMQGLLKN